MMLLVLLLGCSPALRFPGPLGGLGGDPGLVAPRPACPGGRGCPEPTPQGFGPDAIVAAAQGFVGASSLEVDGTRFRWDCSGLVEAVMARAGGDYAGSSADMYERARAEGVLTHRRRPKPGDLVFFDDTYDRNRNGRRDDPLSHVALVEAVAADGTATLIHLGSKGVVRIRMNLREPDIARTEDGRVLNDYLRARREGDSPRTRYLAGELWAGTAAPGARAVARDERATRASLASRP